MARAAGAPTITYILYSWRLALGCGGHGGGEPGVESDASAMSQQPSDAAGVGGSGGGSTPPDLAENTGADASAPDAADAPPDAPPDVPATMVPGDASTDREADLVDVPPVERCSSLGRTFLRCEGNVRVDCSLQEARKYDCASVKDICVNNGAGGLQGCVSCDPLTFGNACQDIAGVLTAVYCAANGEIYRKACPECANGCCNDGDGDGIRGCEGDCYDGDPRVFPGQTAFFNAAYTIPGAGVVSWDYDCDRKEEKQFEALQQRSAGCCNCWLHTGIVPYCGGSGDFRFDDGGPAAFCPDGTSTQRCH